MQVLRILLLPPTPATVFYRPWAVDRSGFSPLLWYVERLEGRYGVESLVVACSRTEDVTAAEEVLQRLNVFVALCESGRPHDVMTELGRALGVRNVVCFGLESLFAPTALMDALVEDHLGSASAYTRVDGLPELLCPEAIDVTCSGARQARLFKAEALTGEAPATNMRGFWYPEDVERTRVAVQGLGEQWGWEILNGWMQARYEPPPITVQRRQPHPGGKRILYLCAGCLYAGAEECQRGLAGELTRLGFEGVALTSAESLFADRMREAGCEVVVPNEDLLGPRTSHDGTRDWNYELACELMDAVRPNVIHVNAAINRAFYRAAGERGIRTAVHVRSAAMTRTEDYEVVDKVVVVSEFAKASLCDGGMAADKMVVVYEGVDTDRFAPACYDGMAERRGFGIPAAAFVVVMIARLDRQKRQDLALAALADLVGRGIDAQFVFAGTADAGDWSSELLGIVESQRLHGRVTYMDFQNDVRPVLSIADTVILPSDREAFGMCIAEAMAMGNPVVVSDAGGSAELVEDGISGLVMRGGDSASLADALARIHGDQALGAELGRNARLRACQKFSLRLHGERMARVLEALS